MSYDAAFTRTEGSEGDYSNRKSDSGGKTRFGMTEAVARTHGYTGAMEVLPFSFVKTAFKTDYWDLIHLDRIDGVNPAVAAEMFDIGVMMGVSIPVPFLQRALNLFNRGGTDYADIPVDGLLGTQTAAVFQAYMNKRGAMAEKVMLAALRSQRGNRFFQITEARPKDEDSAFGWFARIAA